jgi:hypothetical protein
MDFSNGQMVHKADGTNGIVVDSHVRKSGMWKGHLSVQFVGGIYGTSAIKPEELREGWIV